MRKRRSPYNFHLYNLIWLLLWCNYTIGQTVTVTDPSGITLPGVEVYNEDKSFGELTDENGIVELLGISPDEPVHFRYLGYQELITTISQIASQNYQVQLQLSDQILEEVVVLGRKSVAQSEIPFQVKTINIKEIQATNAQTSADALAQHGGLYVQKSQMGGGSPVIRGFEANRVLLVIDDIRLNNAIYRSGHLQNAITVDQAMLDRMEVIFGPNSLMYGSDALGGVVNFKTRNPGLSASSELLTKTNYYLRHATANNEKSAHLDFSIGGKEWGSLTSITYSDYGDLRSGSRRDERFPDFGKRSLIQSIGRDGMDISITNENPDVQIGTSYNQIDLFQKFLLIPNPAHRITANVQYSTSSDVPRYDNLSESSNGSLRWAEWYYGPQERLLTALDYRHLDKTTLYDQLIIIGAYQKIAEDRIFRRFGNHMRITQQEDVDVFSLTVDASKYLDATNDWAIEYGADIQENVVQSQAQSEDVVTNEVSFDVLTRYASGENSLRNIGAYLYFKGKSKNDKINFNSGVRYARSSYLLRYLTSDPVEWPASFYEGINGANQAVTWSVGSTWALSKEWQLRSMISTAFRSPNIDDLSKVSVNGTEITFPNLEIKPERSSNLEVSIAYRKGKVINAGITGFYTRLTDAILRRPFIGPDGMNVWVTQGETLDVVGNVNAQKGIIKGLSLNLDGHISDSWHWYGSMNFTHGAEDITGDDNIPLAHIPPTYGKLGLDYTAGPLSLKGIYRYNAGKPIEHYGGSADNPDLATPIGALAWSTINLYATYQVKANISTSISIENITDKHYRPFSSGLSAPGRNFIFSVRGSF